MLMDLFHAYALGPKRRVHHHPFMLEIHARLFALRHQQTPDPLVTIAHQLAPEARLLCLDEFYVRDPADAMIMGRLFTALIQAGVIIVTTSNRPPRDLYKDGLNRELFLPFIDLVENRLDVLPLNGPTDYRLDRLGGLPTWYTPNGPAATAALSKAFFRLTDFPVEDAVHPQSAEGRSCLQLQAPVRPTAGRGRLSRARSHAPHGDPRRHTHSHARQAQRGGALHVAGRHAVRDAHQATRRG